MTSYSKGSEWRKWDLHIHTPASFHWNGPKFTDNPCSSDNISLIDEMIEALNAAEPQVFAIMDYWTFNGWFALKHRLSQSDAPKLKKTVFPGIELRLVAPMEGRLNAHVLFSDEVDDQVLKDFRAELMVALIDRPLSDYSLKCLARKVGKDLLQTKGYKKEEVDTNDAIALESGSKIAEITCESYKKAIKNVPNDMAIGFMPFNTNDGLADVKWQEHYAYVLGLFDTSPIFETRIVDSWAAFVGVETEINKTWIENFQNALSNIPRLAVSGSDAHRFIGHAGNNDKRGYGDFPSGKATWIKANPTFEGLRQAIREPAKRSFIGECPLKKKIFNENKSRFIDRLEINKIQEATLPENWLDETKLTFSPDLIAIIGNKGSGKSALADITALLGNSKQSRHFSFLKKNRFRGRSGDPAKQFAAKVFWADDQILEKNLNENPAIENIELVKYIPQGHFEELCNAHVSGQSDAFEKELRTVIFSHADDSIRLGALDFDQLIEQQENALRSRLDDLRIDLQKINRQIVSIESQMSPETKKTIIELASQQQRRLDEHLKIEPIEIAKPTDIPSLEQQEASDKLAQISLEIDEIKITERKNHNELTLLAAKKKACKNIREQISLVKRSVQQFMVEVEKDSKILDIEPNNIIKLDINEELIDQAETSIQKNESDIQQANIDLKANKEKLIESQRPLSALLNGPQQAYQKYLDEFKIWEEKRDNLLGSKEIPESLIGLKDRIAQLEKLPKQRSVMQKNRIRLTEQIFDTLDEQRRNREELFKPVQQLILKNKLIRNEYKLQFRAELDSTSEFISNQLFSIVKQNIGEFRGEAERNAVIRELTDTHDLSTKKSLIEFITELHDKLESAANGQIGINSLLRKNRFATEAYDFIFGLEYLKPRYTLMFQDAQIGQLSPGQRGALLLIFYLLVDKGNTPIILDQPEENLDNETIVSLLVPVLEEAKQNRQILMVTHNPNLAVVCDAEQIIHCKFDRKNGNRIIYTSGAIECRAINKKVVDVLEGTMPAFDNRKIKYHKIF